MRNIIILSIGAIFILSLALFGAGTGERFGGQSQLAAPYASGLHVAARTSDNTIQLSGDYLWRFVYAWDGTSWRQQDIGQLLGLSTGTVPGTLSHADNRYIIAGSSFRPSFTSPNNATHLAFYTALYQQGNWCGGCDNEGNSGQWQVVEVSPLHNVTHWSVLNDKKLELYGMAKSYPLPEADTFFTLYRTATSSTDKSFLELEGTELSFTLYGAWQPEDFSWSLEVMSIYRWEGEVGNRSANIAVAQPSEIVGREIRFVLPSTAALNGDIMVPLRIDDEGNFKEPLSVILERNITSEAWSRLEEHGKRQIRPFLVSFGGRDIKFPFSSQNISNREDTPAYRLSAYYWVLPASSEEEITVSMLAEFIGEVRQILPQNMDIAEVVFRLFTPDFGKIAQAAVVTDISLNEVIQAFNEAGYLRQGVRAAISGGAEPVYVVRALYGAGIGIDQLRQLRNEFLSTSSDEFRALARGAGYESADDFPFEAPRGIRINGREYRRIRLQGVYTKNPGAEEEIVAWEDTIRNILDRVSAFYGRELRGAITVDFQIYPASVTLREPVAYGNGSRPEVELATRITNPGGDLYLPEFARFADDETYDIFVIFSDEQATGVGGWGSPGQGIYAQIPYALIASFIPSSFSSYSTAPSEALLETTAHEVGHALSFPHSWEVVGSPDIGMSGFGGISAFRSVRGNIMGYARTPSFDQSFLTDDIVNLILVGEESSFDEHERDMIHKDPISFTGFPESQNDIRRYITREKVAGFDDARIVERLLADGVPAREIVRAYQEQERGIERLITAVAGRFPLENILVAFRSAGFSLREMRALPRIINAFLSSGVSDREYFPKIFEVFPCDSTC